MMFYLRLSGPYDSILIGIKNKELVLNFTKTTGTLPNLHGLVTYRIQVSAVYIISHSGLELTGNRSAAVTATTAEGGTYFCASVC